MAEKETKKEEKCTLYTPTTDTSHRCLICGKLKWEHKYYIIKKVIEKYNGVDVDNLYNSKKNRNSKERLSKEDSQRKLSYYLTKYISKNNTLSERLPWHCSRDISALFISINYSESNQPEIVKLIADNPEAVVSYFDEYFTLSFYKFQPDENYFKDLIDVNNQIFEFMNTN